MTGLLTARELAAQQRGCPLAPGDLGHAPHLCWENE